MILNKKALCAIITLLCLGFLALVAIEGYSHFEKRQNNYYASAIDMISERMGWLIEEINNVPRSVANDILFLKRLSSARGAIDDLSPEANLRALKNLRSDFLEFMSENTVYYQLRYINKKGDEIVKISFDGQNYIVLSQDKLQNKKDRYYFKQAMQLSQDEVLVSELDLNIENDEIENRGSKENPVYVPVIRYAAPVFDKKGEKKGIIIANIYADYFLQDIRSFQKPGEKLFLINKEGYYLTHPDRKKEFAFMFGRDDNFQNDYPEAAKIILNKGKERKIETDNKIFTFRHVYPNLGNFEIYKNSEKVFSKNSVETHFWTLVSVSDKHAFNYILNSFKKDYLFFLLDALLITLFIIALVFVLGFTTSNCKK